MDKYKLKVSLLLTTSVLIYLFLGVLFINMPINPDQATFDYIAWMVNGGATLYKDVADQNWPGQMFVHMASAKLFGVEFWSFRLFELIFIIPISCLTLYIFLRHVLDSKPLAILIFPIYSIMYMTAGYWSSGQRELVAAPLMIAAIIMMLRRMEGGARGLLIAQGVFIALATLIRPTLLILAPLLAFVDLCWMKKTERKFMVLIIDHLLAAIVIIGLIGSLILLAWPSGALKAWYQISIIFNLEAYSFTNSYWDIITRTVKSMISSWHWYIAWSLIGAICLYKRKNIALSLLLALIPVTFISLLVQGKGFGYHLLTLMPMFAVLIVVSFSLVPRLIAYQEKQIFHKFIIVILCLIPLAGLSKKILGNFDYQLKYVMEKISKEELYRQYDVDGITLTEITEISTYIKTSKSPNDKILFWGRPAHIYNLTALSSPLIFASTNALFIPNEDFSLFDSWYTTIENTLKETPPEFIILMRDGKGGYKGMPLPSINKKFSDLVFRALDTYKLVQSYQSVDIFQLSGQAQSEF